MLWDSIYEPLSIKLRKIIEQLVDCCIVFTLIMNIDYEKINKHLLNQFEYGKLSN